MSYFTNLLGRPDREPTEEGSAEDSRRQQEQRSLQTGSPNADWAFQRRYYDRKISRELGPPIAPFPNPYDFGPDAL